MERLNFELIYYLILLLLYWIYLCVILVDSIIYYLNDDDIYICLLGCDAGIASMQYQEE